MKRKNDFIKMVKTLYELYFGYDCKVELKNEEKNDYYYLDITNNSKELNDLGRGIILTDNTISYPHPTYNCFNDKELMFFDDIKRVWENKNYEN